ncbi:MAG: enoyl-CoA hydratase/isomerase family protein [Leptospiraceae bacterium]|nr:enoyl-CoA hydratase/isomerase family protein [Leptospiraceae bacterium]MCP5494130.1 enoyl-CoA hydratase/isomerase family protein [Leptospiraceae bacterium]
MANFNVEKRNIKGGAVAYIGIATNDQNSVTRTQLLEFKDVLTQLNSDPSIRGFVIHSKNEKFFCNGVDAQNIANTPREQLAEEMGEIVKFFVFLTKIHKPMIAEIGGYAMGGGAVIALACDYRFMLTGKARVSFTEVFFGLPLPGVFIDKIKETVLSQHVTDMIYGGAYKAEEAKMIGFIDEIAEDRDSLSDMVQKKMENILRIPTSAFEKTKESRNILLSKNELEHMEALKTNFANPVIQTNLYEAMKAFNEKRKPEFI